MRNIIVLAGLVAALPSAALAQSAGEVERCFQNPAACSFGSNGPPAQPAPPTATAARTAPAPDYQAVLKGPEGERRKIQEALRTLDKYSGPIDGNLQSAATVKAIGDWQKGHRTPVTGKLTPTEAKALIEEAAKVPIKRIDPSTQMAAPTPLGPKPDAGNANAEALKALQARLAERRKAAEPKADAATQMLIRDLEAYVAADGKGIAGQQFPGFAAWYAEVKASGRNVASITPTIEDYGDAKGGAAAAVEMSLQAKLADAVASQCLVFAWIEASPRKNTQTFSCDDVAAVEKWKTDQALRSAWR
jgi:hypothetical protein